MNSRPFQNSKKLKQHTRFEAFLKYAVSLGVKDLESLAELMPDATLQSRLRTIVATLPERRRAPTWRELLLQMEGRVSNVKLQGQSKQDGDSLDTSRRRKKL